MKVSAMKDNRLLLVRNLLFLHTNAIPGGLIPSQQAYLNRLNAEIKRRENERKV